MQSQSDQPTSSHLCPVCSTPMVHSAVGYMCPECGHLERHQGHSGAQAPEVSLQPTAKIIHQGSTALHQPAQEAAQPKPQTQPNSTDSPETSSPEAIRFHKRLKARIKRLVIPELPSHLSEPELPSPLSEPELPSSIGADELPTTATHHEPSLNVDDIATDSRPTSNKDFAVSTEHPTPPAHKPVPSLQVAADSPTLSLSEQAESKETLAFELAEDIAERDVDNTGKVFSGPNEPPQVPSDKSTQANPAEQNATPREAQQAVEARAEDTQSPKLRQNQVLIGTLASLALVIGLGYWLTSRQSQPAPTAPTAPLADRDADQEPSDSSAEALERDQKRKDDLNTISAALEVYKQQEGSYPAGDDIKVIYPLQYTSPPYISYINYDPSSSETKKIKYAYQSDGATFTLAAKLENTGDQDAQDGYYIVRSK